jgi:hypothetical protein
MYARLLVSSLAIVESGTLALVGATVTSAATSATPTPVGTVLKVGKPAIVPYTDSSKPKLKATIQITPESIVKGSIKSVLTKSRPDLYLNGSTIAASGRARSSSSATSRAAA